MYRVLWLEDEVEKVEGFFDVAYAKNIELDHATTLKEFKNKIENNPKYHYDAVILDALGVNESKEESASLNVLYNAILYLAYHREKENLPFFVLSAYLGTQEHKNVRDMIGEDLIFIKTSDEEKLIEAIKLSIEHKHVENLKHKYKDVVQCFSKDFLGVDNYVRMMNLLLYVDSNKTEENAEDKFNAIRQILERMFTKLSELNIIPNEIKENKGWINRSSLFLSNLHNDFEHVQNFMNPLVAFNVYHLLQVFQDASHDDITLKLKTVQYSKAVNNDYFYKSSIYAFFDIIVWFKNFIDQNSDKEENLKLWKKKDLDATFIMKGIIEQDKDRNFYCGSYILSYTYVSTHFKLGDEIIITETSANNTEKTKEIYPLFGTKFIKAK
jgi:hypothetical protein